MLKKKLLIPCPNLVWRRSRATLRLWWKIVFSHKTTQSPSFCLQLKAIHAPQIKTPCLRRCVTWADSWKKSRVSPGRQACQVEKGPAGREGSLTQARELEKIQLMWLDAGCKDGPVKWKGQRMGVGGTAEKAMASHSSTLAWKIPWMEEPSGLQSMGSLRVGYNWATSLSLFTFLHWRRKWQPTPVFLPGESQGRRSLVGCRLWGHTESDTTEAT